MYTSSQRKTAIKNADMSQEMQQDAIQSALSAFQKYSTKREIAKQIKQDFDQRKGSVWHCIVGSNFGSDVTHESKHFIFFYVGQLGVLLWKTT